MSQIFQSDLEQFQLYLAKQVQDGDPSLSPEECLARYRAEHPNKTALRKAAEEIRLALDGMDRGDQGRPYQEVLAELRHRYQLPAPR